MGRDFVLPDLGEGLTEAEIRQVLVREGEVVREDAPLLEVETDKATVEIPSPFGGRVDKIHVQPGQTVKVGQILVSFGEGAAGGGKQAADTLDPTRTLAAEPKTEVAPSGRARQAPPAPEPATSGPAPGQTATAAAGRAAPPTPAPAAAAAPAVAPALRREGPVPAAPSTRRLARELGVDLHAVNGSGPGGRVTDDDVRAAAAGPAARGAAAPGEAAGHGAAVEPTAARPAPRGATEPLVAKPLTRITAEPPLPKFEQWGPIERHPLSHLRRTIAERMTLSATVIPHVTHFDRADITALDALIQRNLAAGQARGVTLTLTSFLLKAAALALSEHPQFNASLDSAAGELIVKRYIHIGVAVATDRGLIVPVIRDVDQKPLLEVQRELAALAQRTRDGRAALDDLRGGTFTITNIGALGGTGAIPIINYPEVAILGVARGRQEAVVVDGAIVPRLLLPVSLTFDHRVADGADGARFASAIVRRLEHPDDLLLGL
jgi:pyruvate dehydrogenase E2 component (dihydrolipoamide acetyltransferase)